MRHPATLAPAALAAECEVRFTRRSGPGGQNRNKVETAVILTHRASGISAEASERRGQAENRKVALHRLRIALALGLRTPSGPTSELWRGRCRAGRIAANPTHEDYPALLAEALDALRDHDWNITAAAAARDCTATQLVKLLAGEPHALALLNQARSERGLKPLKP